MRMLLLLAWGLAGSSIAAAAPAADLSSAFEQASGRLSLERTAFQEARALEQARQRLVDGAIVLQADGAQEPLAVLYEGAALENVVQLSAAQSDDPAVL